MNYPNNVGLTILLSDLFRFTGFLGWTNYLWVGLIFNIVMLDISVLLTFLVCRKLFGAKGACISLVFSFFSDCFHWLDFYLLFRYAYNAVSGVDFLSELKVKRKPAYLYQDCFLSIDRRSILYCV
jgi:hypothetical protein